jgi:hypothetical protein
MKLEGSAEASNKKQEILQAIEASLASYTISDKVKKRI